MTFIKLIPGSANSNRKVSPSRRIYRSTRKIVRALLNCVRPSYGLHGLDRIVAEAINMRNGVFVEIGANDGSNQSNTLLLESRYGWRGLLIEPIPELYRRCLKNRPRAVVVNSACAGPDLARLSTIRMTACDQMSFVTDLMRHDERESWVESAKKFLAPNAVPYDVRVPCRTISAVLDEHGVTVIDLLSLDVEGAEIEVLKGLDLARHNPKWILVEINKTPLEAVIEALGETYEVVGTYFSKDALLRRKCTSRDSAFSQRA